MRYQDSQIGVGSAYASKLKGSCSKVCLRCVTPRSLSPDARNGSMSSFGKKASVRKCCTKFLERKQELRLYIHIPFCDSKCGYCAFYSNVGQKKLYKPYMDSLKLDLGNHLSNFEVMDINSVFVGGGTPNIIDAILYDEIFSILNDRLSTDCEITFESNPNLVTYKWCRDAKSLGLNRISLGVQSFYEDKLKILDRAHSTKHIRESLEHIKSAGIDNINLDLIHNCCTDTKLRLENELKQALDLPITHISAYSLSLDEGSKFETFKMNNKISRESFDRFVRDLLVSNGAFQYEVSNYVVNGVDPDLAICKHNVGYWNYDEYIGVGASSVGRVGNIRYYAVPDVHEYMKEPFKRRKEILSNNDMNFEQVFLGLRSKVGVKKDLVRLDIASMLISEGLCYEKNGRLYNNDYYLADEISTRLCI